MVIGHFTDSVIQYSDVCKSIFLFIYAYHMPVLLFISGLFYKRTKYVEKTLYYISGGFAIKIFLSIIWRITSSTTSFFLLGDSELPWFFFVLAIYQILMYLLRDVNKRYLFVATVILACFVGYDESIGDFLYLSRIIVFFPFYLLGNIITQEKVNQTIKRFYRILLPCAVLIIVSWFYLSFFKLDTVYIFRHLFTGRNPFSDDVIKYGPLARLLCYFITFITGASVIVLIPQKRIPFITALGAHTENVYFWHWGIYVLMHRFFHINNLFMGSFAEKVCFMIIPILMSIVLCYLDIFRYPLHIIRKMCFKDNQELFVTDKH